MSTMRLTLQGTAPSSIQPQRGQLLNWPQGIDHLTRRHVFVNGRTAPAMPQTTVYHYIDNRGEQVASLLPSDHPEMICLLGGHVPEARYGMLGIMAAVLWFPLGICFCMLDQRVKCRRCGYMIDDGTCG